MEACKAYKELIMLDCHNELDSGDQDKLRTHLRSCSSCRQERKRLQAAMDKVRASCEPPALSAAEVETAIMNLHNRLEESKDRPLTILRIFSSRLVPVAAACVFIVAGIFGYRSWISAPEKVLRQQAEISKGEMEIILNLDLLQDLDTISRLVSHVDKTPMNMPDDYYDTGACNVTETVLRTHHA
ncbi:MAG: zf-HC2 domain-containing protein [Deltaproteobacteria bacterium]|nr:zf-HC2 domain-containing protein [Deltaproteobacteria bacterium]